MSAMPRKQTKTRHRSQVRFISKAGHGQRFAFADPLSCVLQNFLRPWTNRDIVA
jgi:hypothetical protein